MRQAFFTAPTQLARWVSSPMAEPSNHTGATTDPTAKPLALILSASFLIPSSVMSILTCGS